MKAYVCREFGPVDSHKVEEIEDPRAEPGMVVVDVKAVKKLKKPVSLEKIKLNNKLKNIALIKQSRLSVMPIKEVEWNEIIKMSSI